MLHSYVNAVSAKRPSHADHRGRDSPAAKGFPPVAQNWPLVRVFRVAGNLASTPWASRRGAYWRDVVVEAAIRRSSRARALSAATPPRHHALTIPKDARR
jgi:hypothetical protein